MSDFASGAAVMAVGVFLGALIALISKAGSDGSTDKADRNQREVDTDG